MKRWIYTSAFDGNFEWTAWLTNRRKKALTWTAAMRNGRGETRTDPANVPLHIRDQAHRALAEFLKGNA